MSFCSRSDCRSRDSRSTEGQHKVYFGGRVYVGPDRPSLLLTFLLVVLPTGVFLGLIAPDAGRRLHWSVVAVAALLILVVYASLLTTAFRNPGIIKRRYLPANVLRDVGHSSTVTVNGQEITVKFCHTCQVQRPPRCSHCAVCDNCVEKFDHHCPWMGTCIGRRNYRSYMVFVVSTTLLCFYVAGTCTALLVDIGLDESFVDALRKQPGAVVIGVFSLVASVFPLGLAIFHCYLISKNYTTYEHFKSKMQRQENPYNRGLWANYYEVCCYQTQAFEYQYDDEDQDGDMESQIQGTIQMSEFATNGNSQTPAPPSVSPKRDQFQLQKQFQQSQMESQGYDRVNSGEGSQRDGGGGNGVVPPSAHPSNQDINDSALGEDERQRGSRDGCNQRNKQQVVMDMSLNDIESQSSGAELESPKNRGNRSRRPFK